MTTQEQWETYLQQYNTNLQNVKQNVDVVVNSGTATQAEKDKARSDYAKQLAYYNILQGVYNAAVESGTFPDTFDIDSSNKGSYSGIYTITGDSTIYMSNIIPCEYEGVCAVSEHFNVFWKVYRETGGDIIDLPDLYPDYVTVFPGYGQDSQGFFAGWVFDSTLVFDAWVMTKDNSNFFTTTWNYQTGIASGTNISQFAAHIYSNNTIPVFTQGQSIDRFTMFGGQGLAIVLPEAEISTDDPWDYYNDDILPGLNPDNAAFPGGYDPTPPRPDPKDPGTQENDGDDYVPNDPTDLGGGFNFTTQYALRASHLSDIGQKLWAGFDNLQNYLDNFVYRVDPTTGTMNMEDIMQFFISLRAYPCPISAMASTSAGGYDLYIGSGKTPLTLSSPFSVINSFIGYINAGDRSVPYWYGDFRDYDLNITVYLPYCGTAELNPGDIMGGTLHCFYYVDFCTGACTGYVTCDTWDGKTMLVASLPGQLGADVPLTATNAGRVMSRMYGDRINAVSNMLDVAKSAVTGLGAIASGNPAGALRQGISAFIDPALTEQRQLNDAAGRSAIAAPVLSSGKGFASFGTAKTAYLQIRSPIYAAPDNYANSVGVPSSSAVQIGDCSGFCQFVNVDVSGITTDAADQSAIRQALEAGIFV